MPLDYVYRDCVTIEESDYDPHDYEDFVMDMEYDDYVVREG